MSGSSPRLVLIGAQARSQRAFYAALGSGSAAAKLVRWPGVQATVVPDRPWFSILNSALFNSPEALEAVIPQLASAYRECGVHTWRVWVAPEDQDAEDMLVQAGYSRGEGTPQRMAATIDGLDLKPRIELELEPDPSWAVIARCNDRAYGILDEYSLAAAFTTMNDAASYLYAARRGDEIVSALVAREHQGDCYFWFVATLPEARGDGLASELMRHALREAASRGCRTTTLEATAMGESAYARLGYQRLGRFSVFERQEA